MYKFVPKNKNNNNNETVLNKHIFNIQEESKVEIKEETVIINDNNFPVLGMSSGKTVVNKQPIRTVWTKLNNDNQILDKLKQPFPDEVAKVSKSKNLYTYRRREKKKDKYDSNSDDYEEEEALYESCPYITDIDRKYLDSDSEEFV